MKVIRELNKREAEEDFTQAARALCITNPSIICRLEIPQGALHEIENQYRHGPRSARYIDNSLLLEETKVH